MVLAFLIKVYYWGLNTNRTEISSKISYKTKELINRSYKKIKDTSESSWEIPFYSDTLEPTATVFTLRNKFNKEGYTLGWSERNLLVWAGAWYGPIFETPHFLKNEDFVLIPLICARRWQKRLKFSCLNIGYAKIPQMKIMTYINAGLGAWHEYKPNFQIWKPILNRQSYLGLFQNKRQRPEFWQHGKKHTFGDNTDYSLTYTHQQGKANWFRRLALKAWADVEIRVDEFLKIRKRPFTLENLVHHAYLYFTTRDMKDNIAWARQFKKSFSWWFMMTAIDLTPLEQIKKSYKEFEYKLWFIQTLHKFGRILEFWLAEEWTSDIAKRTAGYQTWQRAARRLPTPPGWLYPITTLATPGTYSFRWMIMHVHVRQFGPYSEAILEMPEIYDFNYYNPLRHNYENQRPEIIWDKHLWTGPVSLPASFKSLPGYDALVSTFKKVHYPDMWVPNDTRNIEPHYKIIALLDLTPLHPDYY